MVYLAKAGRICTDSLLSTLISQSRQAQMNISKKNLGVLQVLLWPTLALCQGTLRINFDGLPAQVPGSQVLVQQYSESGISFQPLAGSDGFARVWTGMPPEWPSDGTPYLQATTGDSLSFRSESGSSFGLLSVDLAAFTTGLPDYTLDFIGYLNNGGTVSTSFSGTGINFQTYNFGPDWSSGLTRVEISNYAWSLDNLVVAVPEPGIPKLIALGAIVMASKWCKRMKA